MFVGEVVEGKCGMVVGEEDYDWVGRVDGGNVMFVEVDGFRVGYVMLDVLMDLREISILLFFMLRLEGGFGVWGLGMVLMRVI